MNLSTRNNMFEDICFFALGIGVALIAFAGFLYFGFNKQDDEEI